MKNYEIAVILSPDLDDKSLHDMKETIKDWISSSGGEIVLTDDRGKRKLSYQIKKKREGYYISWYASLLPSGPSAIEQQLRLNENILRFMVIKSDVPVQVDKKSLPVDTDNNVVEPVVSIETSEEMTEGNEGADASAEMTEGNEGADASADQSLDEKNEGESG